MHCTHHALYSPCGYVPTQIASNIIFDSKEDAKSVKGGDLAYALAMCGVGQLVRRLAQAAQQDSQEEDGTPKIHKWMNDYDLMPFAGTVY
jgi:hypothetical protein